MRPIKLSLKAIGPFKNKVEIDFSTIGAHELFLIHGKTGSGKTTLFDAICFALYGTVPSGREGCLISDFAEKMDRPFVEFEFELGTERYRAFRQFEYQIPLKTKEGTKRSPEKLEFCRVHDDGTTETLATKKKLMLEVIQERLGLDVNQFKQVVLLPQGEFRQLLLANSSDREKLLERLFDSSFYDGIQNWFEEEAKQFATDNKSVQEKRQTYLDQALDKIPEERRPTEDAVFGVATIDEEVGIFKERIKGESATVKKLTEAAELKLKELETGRQLVNDLTELVLKKAEKVHLEERKGEIERLSSELKQAREASPLIPELDELERRNLNITKLQKSVVEIEGKYQIAVLRKAKADLGMEQIPELEKSAKALGKIKDQLVALRQTVETIGERYEEQAEITDILEEANEQHVACAERLAEISVKLQYQKESAEKLKATEVDSEALRNRLAKLESALTAQKNIKELSLQFEKLKAAFGDADSKRTIADETLAALKERRERNLAGELAKGLLDGESCPVCGGLEHPHPAGLVDEGATTDAIKAAEKSLQRAETSCNETRSAVEKAETTRGIEADNLAELEKDLGENASDQIVAGIKKQLKAESERKKKLQQIDADIQSLEAEQIPQLKEQLAKHAAGKESAETALKKITAELNKLNDQFAEQCVPSIEKQLTEDEVSVDDIDELSKTVAEEAIEITERVAAIKEELADGNELLAGAKSTLDAAKTEISKAQDNLKLLDEEVAGKIKKSIFETKEAVKEAARSPKWIGDSEESIKEYENRGSSVRAVIEALVKRIANREPPDIEALEEVCDEHRTVAGDATEALHDLEHDAKFLKGLSDSIKALEKEFEDIAAKMKVLGRIEQQVRGKGQPKISLKRFFLSHRLEEVLIQASSRLRVLSDGQFELKRDRDVADARSGAGLDLLVSDSFTGTERPVSSLSGGQMFLASLSMALGLADVVQARSGGIRLDTLFIDEGFGSLDDETLQTALKVLNELRKGRMVGVISHVNELRRQIGNRIEVLPANVGSKISMQIA